MTATCKARCASATIDVANTQLDMGGGTFATWVGTGFTGTLAATTTVWSGNCLVTLDGIFNVFSDWSDISHNGVNTSVKLFYTYSVVVAGDAYRFVFASTNYFGPSPVTLPNSVGFGGPGPATFKVAWQTNLPAWPVGSPAAISITITDIYLEYTYIPIPIINSVTPSHGSLAGGTPISIAGVHFDGNGAMTGTASVDFNAASDVVVVSDAEITCKTPLGFVPGVPVNVRITVPYYGSADKSAYTYDGASVDSAVPPNGALFGKDLITVIGTEFLTTGTVTNVYFDGFAASEIQVLDNTSLICRNPAHILPGWVVIGVEWDLVTLVDSSATIFLYEDVVKEYSIIDDEITIEFNTIDPITITNINVGVPVLVWTIINSTTVSFKFIPGNWWVIITFNIYPLPLYLFQTPFTMIGSGGIEFAGTPDIVVSQDLSGIYTLVPNKTTDTYYDRLTGQPTVVTEIPDPMFKTGYIGG